MVLDPTKGRLEDMLTYLPTSGRTGQVFLSSGLTLSMEELYQEYFALLRCPRSVDLDRKVALHLVSMQSSQTWHTMQCLVTAIVSLIFLSFCFLGSD